MLISSDKDLTIKLPHLSLREAFGETLKILGATNSKIVVIDADVSQSTKSAIFAEEFPERFFNVGISEQDMVSIGAGLASCDKIPFVVGFSSFLTTRGLDQIRNMVAYSNLNVKFIGTHAGLATGKDGSSHQALEDIAIMRNIPNMMVFSPSDSFEASEITRKVVDIDGPIYMRLPRTSGKTIHDENYDFNLFQIDPIIDSYDSRIAIFATGTMVSTSLEAVEILKKKGVEINLFNVHTIKPISKLAINHIIKKYDLVISVEDHSITGGLGTTLAEIIAESNYSVILHRMGINDSFGESGSVEELYEKYGLSSTNIAKTVEILSKKLG